MAVDPTPVITTDDVAEMTTLRQQALRYRFPALDPNDPDYHAQLVARAQELNYEKFRLTTLTETTKAYDIVAEANEQTVTINGREYHVRADRTSSFTAYSEDMARLINEAATESPSPAPDPTSAPTQAPEQPAVTQPIETVNYSDFGSGRNRLSASQQTALLVENTEYLDQLASRNLEALTDSFRIQLSYNRIGAEHINGAAHGCAMNSNATIRHIMNKSLRETQQQKPTTDVQQQVDPVQTPVTDEQVQTPPTNAQQQQITGEPTPVTEEQQQTPVTDNQQDLETSEPEPREKQTLLTPRAGVTVASMITTQADDPNYCTTYDHLSGEQKPTLNSCIRNGSIGLGDEISIFCRQPNANPPVLDKKTGDLGCHAMIVADVQTTTDDQGHEKITGYTLAANNPPALTYIDLEHPNQNRVGSNYGNYKVQSVVHSGQWALDQMNEGLSNQSNEQLEQLISDRRQDVHGLIGELGEVEQFMVEHNLQTSCKTSCVIPDGNGHYNDPSLMITHNADGYNDAYQQTLGHLRYDVMSNQMNEFAQWSKDNPVTLGVQEERLDITAQIDASMANVNQQIHETRMQTDKKYRKSFEKAQKQAEKEARRAAKRGETPTTQPTDNQQQQQTPTNDVPATPQVQPQNNGEPIVHPISSQNNGENPTALQPTNNDLAIAHAELNGSFREGHTAMLIDSHYAVQAARDENQLIATQTQQKQNNGTPQQETQDLAATEKNKTTEVSPAVLVYMQQNSHC